MNAGEKTRPNYMGQDAYEWREWLEEERHVDGIRSGGKAEVIMDSQRSRGASLPV